MTTRHSRMFRRFVPVAFVAIHSVLVFSNIWHNSLVIDEPYHIASGLSHFAEHNFRADQVNPPLARMISVLPLLSARPTYDRAKISNEPGARSEWLIGPSWVDLNGSDVVWQTRTARLAGIGWSALGAYLLYQLVKRYRGRDAGTFAVAIWCFDPTIISLAAVVTADLPCAVATIGAALTYDSLIRAERLNVNWSRRLWAGLWLGVALLVKFTLLLLPLYWLAWGIGQQFGSSRENNRHRAPLSRIVQSWLVVSVVALGVVNTGYGFQGTFRRLESYRFVSKTFAGSVPQDGVDEPRSEWGNRFRGTVFAKIPVPLPEDFVLGIDVQRRDFEHPLPSYVNGRWFKHGWWWFYIYAIAIKEPIPWLCLLAWAVCRLMTVIGSRPVNTDLAWLEGLGLILFVFVSAQTGFSHHLRYVLPTYPFLILFMSSIAGEEQTVQKNLPLQNEAAKPGINRAAWSIWMRRVVVVWLAGVAIASTPYSLSYFSPISGGSSQGHRHLLYSNLDWGQGLLQLKHWVENHRGATPLHITYMGPLTPQMIGVDAPPVPSLTLRRTTALTIEPQFSGPLEGYHAVSAMVLHHPFDEGHRYLLEYKPIASLGGSILIYHFGTQQTTSNVLDHSNKTSIIGRR